MISSMFSVPIESLIVFCLIPWSISSASFSSEWVVDAGWIASDLTSATFARSENISRLSMNFLAVSASPLISNVKIEPPPLGKYFLYSLCCSGSVETEGWFTFSTSGWLFRYSTTLSAFDTCLSTRSDSVSSPWRNIHECIGEIVAPVSRRRIALILVTNAAGPAGYGYRRPGEERQGISAGSGKADVGISDTRRKTDK